MNRRDEGPGHETDGRTRGASLRIAGAGLASVLAFAVPLAGGGATADGPELLPPAVVPGYTTLPAGWPGEAPVLKTPTEAETWSIVHAACRRHGILEQAVTLYNVLWEESRLVPRVRSSCGRYYGISQFTRSTFRYNVEAMRRLGLIWGAGEWTPDDPVQAIEVMAWMWSQGYHDHWGPYRRVVRRLANAGGAARLN